MALHTRLALGSPGGFAYLVLRATITVCDPRLMIEFLGVKEKERILHAGESVSRLRLEGSNYGEVLPYSKTVRNSGMS